MRAAIGLLAIVVACEKTPPATPAPANSSLVVTPIDAGAPPAATVVVTPRPVDRCPGIEAGQISDDDTPSIKADKMKDAEPIAWFEARGVTKEKALAFMAAYWQRGVSVADAETYWSYPPCHELTLGDNMEPAILCEQGIPEGIVPTRAIAFVVRKSGPVVVLDVGLHMIALDWPDARWLDLQLQISADGQTAILKNRAPDGTKIVAPPSACREEEAALDQCEKDWANEPNPESYVMGIPGHEALRMFHDRCPLRRGSDGKIHVNRERADQGLSAYPATLHDCAGGRSHLTDMLKEIPAGPDRNDWKRSIAFFDKSCSQRGTYVWQSGRFVKQVAVSHGSAPASTPGATSLPPPPMSR